MQFMKKILRIKPSESLVSQLVSMTILCCWYQLTPISSHESFCIVIKPSVPILMSWLATCSRWVFPQTFGCCQIIIINRSVNHTNCSVELWQQQHARCELLSETSLWMIDRTYKISRQKRTKFLRKKPTCQPQFKYQPPQARYGHQVNLHRAILVSFYPQSTAVMSTSSDRIGMSAWNGGDVILANIHTLSFHILRLMHLGRGSRL